MTAGDRLSQVTAEIDAAMDDLDAVVSALKAILTGETEERVP